MIVSSESVLRKIPALLSRQQALFIEGIRLTIEMADLSHRRLQETLPKLTAMETGQSGANGISAMLDAWSLVDSLHRLRGLLGNLPRIKHRDRILEIRTFFDTTKNITGLRNTVQHLDSEIPEELTDPDWALLGSLSWGVVDPTDQQVTSSSFMPGMPLGTRSLINPANRQIWYGPVDAITTERGGVAVCLSDAMRRLDALVPFLEKMLSAAYARQLPAQEHHAADITISVVMKIVWL